MNSSVHLIRFLLENAGTMLDIYRRAILTALGLDPGTDPSHLRFDPKNTHGIKRNRFFFRNYTDHATVAKCEVIPFQESYGPLLDKHGRPIPFGPLLRVRATLDHGIHQLSWTACQPISLVWDYQHWGGRLTFCEQANMLPGDTVRSLSFDRALPPNLLQAWIDFLNSAKQRDLANSNRDRLVIASLPIFHHPRIRAPMRMLNQEEVQRIGWPS